MIRVPFPRAVERAIVERATEGGRVYCEGCGAGCRSRADYEIDHIVPEGVRMGEREPLSAEDGKLLCIKCHDRKTRRDVAEIARAKRLEGRHRVIGAGPTEIARRYGLKQETNR
ncbi:MAG TPA: HNH endonuclease [Caulobacteraceae bacterium]|jgi:hypothetical protein